MRYKRPTLRNIGLEIDPKAVKMWENFDKLDIEGYMPNVGCPGCGDHTLEFVRQS